MIKQRTSRRAIKIDLKSPEGNAFYLLGTAQSLAKKLGYDNEKTDALIVDMTSSDYENLIQVFDKHFGDFVILYR
jgi:hypothetical protein